MILLSSIIQQFEESFMARYKTSLLPGHKNALWAMKRCRKESSHHMLAKCTNATCGQQILIPHSCGHRSCPHCQNHEGWQWIENQLKKQLPAEYFLITFTLPNQLRKLAWKNQKLVYTLMFQCVQELLKTFTHNDKHLQGTPGFTTILHTHSRRLEFHPHIHVVMPAASINAKYRLWRVKTTKYIFSHKALAKVFRAKILKTLVEKKLHIPRDCPKQWVVDCRNVGNGDKALIYLGRYLYKGIIQEKDIIKSENGMVTFRYLDSKTKTLGTRTVTGEYFLWLIVIHVLPKGFRKSRCYGFLHPCSKKIIQLLQLILRFPLSRMSKTIKQRPKITCRYCGAKMEIICTMIPSSRLKPTVNFA